MRVKIPYGNSYLEHDFGANCRVVHSKIAEMKPDGAGEEIVRKAMAYPISSQTLRELAVGKQNAVIIISDHTRPVPSKKIIPFMLQELREGSPDIDITLLVATGCHRETEVRELREKLGEEILQKEKIVIHNCDSEDMVNLGKLPSGAELVINRRAADCDLLLAEGFIEPHFFAGFSGGRKSILPGICSRRTVLGNHCSTFIASENARMGVLYGNPIHADMIDAVKKARLAYIVNVVIDPEKNVVAAFAGDAIEAHAEGCRFLKNYCCVPVGEKADIVVTSNGGAPLDQNVYQAVKGMTTAESFCRQGGVIIMCAECADGIGGELFFRKMADCRTLEALEAEILATPMAETIPDQWQYQILVRIMKKHHVILVCDEKNRTAVQEMKMEYAADLEEAMQKAASALGSIEAASITVIPDGVSVIGI